MEIMLIILGTLVGFGAGLIYQDWRRRDVEFVRLVDMQKQFDTAITKLAEINNGHANKINELTDKMASLDFQMTAVKKTKLPGFA